MRAIACAPFHRERLLLASARHPAGGGQQAMSARERMLVMRLVHKHGLVASDANPHVQSRMLLSTLCG